MQASRTSPNQPSGGSSPVEPRPRLAAALIGIDEAGRPQAIALRSDVLARIEAELPRSFFERAPFRRIAIYLLLPAAAASSPRAPLALLDDGWLDWEAALPAAVWSARNPAQRRASLEAALLGALVEAGRRFGLPTRRLRQIRHRRLAQVPLRRRG